MPTPQSNFSFRVMAWMFKVRDLLLPRKHILAEVDIQPGFRVLDYGCGPGGYTVIAAWRAVGLFRFSYYIPSVIWSYKEPP